MAGDPRLTVSDDGVAEMVKSCAPAVTVSVTVVLCCTPPPLPVTVMGYVPGVVLDDTVIVIVEVPVPGAGMVLGLNPTVTPDGMPDADNAIELLKPLVAVVVMVDVP